MSRPPEPVRNNGATMACALCGRGFMPSGRRRFCSDACRQAAFRARVAAPEPFQPARANTVYECPGCEARFVGTQRCDECNLWCRRLGPGALCPHCEEPVALGDIVSPAQMAAPRRKGAKK